MVSIRRMVRRDVPHGGPVPAGWRLAWYEPRRRVAVYGPVPLHWVLRFGRELFHRLRKVVATRGIERAEIADMQRKHAEQERLADEYSRGYLNGWRECFHACLTTVEDEFDRANEVWEVGELLRGRTSDRGN